MLHIIKDIDFVAHTEEGQSNESGPICIRFKIYEIIGYNTEDDSPIYHQKDYINSDETETNIDNAQIFLSETVKWDGCSDWHFDEQDNVMIHGCSRKDLNRIGKLFDSIYDLAAELMPNHKEILLENKK